MTTRDPEQRVLVYAPEHRNAAVIEDRLRQAVVRCIVCQDVDEFEECLNEEAPTLSAVVLTSSAVRAGASPIITQFQRLEPDWSSLPLILLAPPGDVKVPPWPHTTVIDQPTTARHLVRVLDLAGEVRSQQRRLARANRRLERIAFEDSLTGLPNRVALYERIRELQRERRGSERTFSAVFLDLDAFKRINDDFGHHAGDEALRQVALHLSAAVRASDFVARWGGDEFIVLLVGEEEANEHTVGRLAKGVTLRLDAAAGPIDLALSVGRLDEISPDQTTDEILSIADARMYEHKYRKERPGRG